MTVAENEIARDDGSSFVVTVSMEAVLYALVAIAAAVTRFAALGSTPLTGAEAAQAMPVVDAVAGSRFDMLGVSPLLFALQHLTFGALGATELTARFWPALLGASASLLFIALRDRLGRWGALIGSAAWALSPLAALSDRAALSSSLVAPVALAQMVCVSRFLMVKDERRLMACGISAAFLLLSGPGAYTVLLIAGLAVLFWRRELVSIAERLPVKRRDLFFAFGVPLILVGTVFLTVPQGLAAAVELLGAWIRGLNPQQSSYGVWAIGRTLLVNEPFLVIFALMAIVLAATGLVKRIGSASRETGFREWAVLALILDLLVLFIGGGRQPGDLGLTVLLLILVAAPLIGRVIEGVIEWRQELDNWLLVVLSVIFLGTSALCLVSFYNPTTTETWRRVYEGVGWTTLILAVAVWIAYGLLGSWRSISRAAPLVLLVLGSAWGISRTAGINVQNSAWQQNGIFREVPASGLGDLQAELGQLMALSTGREHGDRIDLVFTNLEEDDIVAVMRWMVRQHESVRISASLPEDPAPLVITIAGDQAGLADRYSGAEFAVMESWSPDSQSTFADSLRWVFYRESKIRPSERSVVLWVDRSRQ